MKELVPIRLEAFVAGDRRVYQEIFDTFYESLCLFAHRFVKDLPVCEDCAQESFISLWNSRHEIESVAHLKSFLYQVCRNQVLNHLKHERVRAAHAEEVARELGENVCFINSVIEEETERILRQTEMELPPKCREIFILDMQGKDNEEIARMLGISENTVKTQKKIAYRRLKQNVKDLSLLVALLLQ